MAEKTVLVITLVFIFLLILFFSGAKPFSLGTDSRLEKLVDQTAEINARRLDFQDAINRSKSEKERIRIERARSEFEKTVRPVTSWGQNSGLWEKIK